MANENNLSSSPSPSSKKKRNGGSGRIEMRTQPGLKEAMVARSCNGFGTKGYGLSKMLRYAFLHMLFCLKLEFRKVNSSKLLILPR